MGQGKPVDADAWPGPTLQMRIDAFVAIRIHQRHMDALRRWGRQNDGPLPTKRDIAAKLEFEALTLSRGLGDLAGMETWDVFPEQDGFSSKSVEEI